MLFGTQPTDPWTRNDFRLIEAYQTLQDETCQHCGHPIWLCRNEDPDLLFEVRVDTCQADAETQKWHKKQEDAKGKKKQKPGAHPYTVPMKLNRETGEMESTNLPSRRSYFEQTS